MSEVLFVVRHEAEAEGKCGGSGQLCWTPESSASLETEDCRDTGLTAQSIERDLPSSVTGLCKREDEPGQESGDVRLRKGVSVPNVSCDQEEDRQSSSSDNCKSHRRTFLRTLGLGGKASAGVKPGHKMRSLKKTLSSLFRGKADHSGQARSSAVPPGQRALPPVPARLESARDEVQDESPDLQQPEDGSGETEEDQHQADNLMDFAASIEKVKDRGWYWGPLSGEAAERILSGEPDGSFVVRDSSDQHYIFSLTFKLNGFVRHVRIEHDQGDLNSVHNLIDYYQIVSFLYKYNLLFFRKF